MTVCASHEEAPAPAAAMAVGPPRTLDPGRPPGAGLLLLPPWRRALRAAAGAPAAALAVVAAATILACTSSSAALFLSSASSASLQRLLAAECPEAAAAAVRTDIFGTDSGSLDPRSLSTVSAQVDEAMVASGFGPPAVLAMVADPVRIGDGTAGVRVMYGTDALDQVTRLSGRPGTRGVWLSEQSATQAGLRAGDEVRIGELAVPVAGTFRNLFEEPLRPYWCSQRADVLNLASSDRAPPPPMLVSDLDLYETVSATLPGSKPVSWISPVGTPPRTASAALDVVRGQLAAYERADVRPALDYGTLNSGPGQLPALTERVALVREGLRGAILPVALAGTVLALLLVGAAGSYWADRREPEVRLLSVRGVGPTGLAVKAVLEMALPAAVGAALGGLLAWRLVVALGPSPDLDAGTPWRAALTVAAALVAGLAVLGAVAGWRAHRSAERPGGARRSRLAAVPWELVPLAAAAGCYAAMRAGDPVVVVKNVAQVSTLTAAFPLLFLVGCAALLVRVVVPLLPRLARRATGLSPAWYLAIRRSTSSRVVAVVLLVAAAAPVAMATYAAGLTAGSSSMLTAKIQVVTGGTTAVLTNDPVRRTPATDAAGTLVERYLYGTAGGVEVAVLAVDPDTLPRTAYWENRFADRPLAELLDRLRGPRPDGAVPALLVDPRGQVPGRFAVRLGASTVDVEQVAAARLFPGRRSDAPMVVVDRQQLRSVDPRAGSRTELWTDGDPRAAEAAVLAQGARLFDVLDAGTVSQAADYTGITWTFGYLTALAAFVGMITVAALLLYVETRQRTRVVAYALGTRMGLTRGVHFRSLLAELGSLLALACLVGAGLAVAALHLVQPLLDVDPVRPPGPPLVVPWAVLAGALAVAAAVTVLVAGYAQRSADRTEAAAVLRLGA